MSGMSHGPEIAISGVILAGGKGSRMGGEDKGLIVWHGKPLYQHVLARLQPQVNEICISANRNLEVYQQSGHSVITDSLAGFPGPLAGMLSALRQAQHPWVVFTPCDTPAIPLNFVEQLVQQRGNAHAVWVRSHIRDHPTLVLIHRDLTSPLSDYLQAGKRRLMQFLHEQGGHAVLLSDDESAFHNINSPEDLNCA